MELQSGIPNTTSTSERVSHSLPKRLQHCASVLRTYSPVKNHGVAWPSSPYFQPGSFTGKSRKYPFVIASAPALGVEPTEEIGMSTPHSQFRHRRRGLS